MRAVIVCQDKDHTASGRETARDNQTLRDRETLATWRIQDNITGMRTVEHLFEQTGLTIEEIAARAGLAPDRVAAIADGRWTPSPQDRERIAVAFGVRVEEVSWGHTMNPRNVRYRRFGLRENF